MRPGLRWAALRGQNGNQRAAAQSEEQARGRRTCTRASVRSRTRRCSRPRPQGKDRRSRTSSYAPPITYPLWTSWLSVRGLYSSNALSIPHVPPFVNPVARIPDRSQGFLASRVTHSRTARGTKHQVTPNGNRSPRRPEIMLGLDIREDIQTQRGGRKGRCYWLGAAMGAATRVYV